MNVQNKVKTILDLKPKTRDDDMSLLLNLWAREFPQYQKDEAIRVFNFIYKNCPKPETIRRIRQKLQEHNPELRGVKYEKRQTRSKQVAAAMRENPGYCNV